MCFINAFWSMSFDFYITFSQIEQDLVSLFGEETSAKLLEKWPTLFKEKAIQQSKCLSSSAELQELIQAAESPPSGNEDLYSKL